MASDLECPECQQKLSKRTSRCPACNASIGAAGGREEREDRDRPATKRKYRRDWDDDDDDDRPTRRPQQKSGVGSTLGVVFVVVGIVVLLMCGGAFFAFTQFKKAADNIRDQVNQPFPNAPGWNPNRPAPPPVKDASQYGRLEPAQVDPALRDGLIVPLDDLTPYDVAQGDWKLGLKGAIGDGSSWVEVNKTVYERAIGMHPPNRGASRASFKLDGLARTFRGEAAIASGVFGSDPWSPVTFRVYADGEQIWQSAPLTKRDQKEPFRLTVAGVRRLTLEVRCEDSAMYAHAAWLEPTLEK